MNGRYTIPKLKATLSVDANMYSRRGYGSSELNTGDFVLNTSLSQPFLKGKLIARIEAFDLLHQLSNTQYAVYFCTFTKVHRVAPSPGAAPSHTTPCCTWCTIGIRTRRLRVSESNTKRVSVLPSESRQGRSPRRNKKEH